MALITCIECGKQFSDRANACPNCGCPTEVILETLHGQGNSTEAEKIIAEYDILGKSFKVTEKLDKGLRMSKAILDVPSVFAPQIEKDYNAFGSIDKVLELMPDRLADTVDLEADLAVKMLVDAGVYEFDKERFCAKYKNIFDASGVFEPIVDKYLEILDMEEAVNEYHDYIAESRKNAWSGGGFGIGGAIKGHIKAQLLNYGNAFLHSIPDSGRRSRDEDKIRRMKAQLYKDPETLKAVTDGFCRIISSILLAALHEMDQAGVVTAPELDVNRSNSLINNVIHSEDLELEQQINICRQAFEANPLNDTVILVSLYWELDENGEVERFAKDYGLYDTYFAQKQSLIKKKYAEEIRELEDNEHNHSNEAFCNKIDLCGELAAEGLDVSEYVTKAVKGRAWRDVSIEDVYVLTDVLCKYGRFLGEDLVEWSVTRILDALNKKV